MPGVRKHHKRSGFSFIELTVVLLVIGILTTVAIPKFAQSMASFRSEAAAKRIAADLAHARQNALSSSATQSVQFTPATDNYTLPGMADLNHSGGAYSVDLAASPYHAVLVAATLGGDSEIVFDRFGKPDSGGTITVESGGFQQNLTIDPDTGKATIP